MLVDGVSESSQGGRARVEGAHRGDLGTQGGQCEGGEWEKARGTLCQLGGPVGGARPTHPFILPAVHLL
jgi:hypothetical protein